MMIRESLAHDLPEPVFAQRGGEFTTVLWRDWLTDKVMAELGLNERQTLAVAYLKSHPEITNSMYQQEFKASKRTASRDLDDMAAKGIAEKVGTTGKGVYYRLAKGAVKGPKGP